jgi:hypothetical protein
MEGLIKGSGVVTQSDYSGIEISDERIYDPDDSSADLTEESLRAAFEVLDRMCDEGPPLIPEWFNVNIYGIWGVISV